MKLQYNTRDEKGIDFVKEVDVKQFPSVKCEFVCSVCNKPQTNGVLTKKIVSSNFTDHAFIGDMVCAKCAELFSLYFYSYVVSPAGIRLMNVREIKEQLLAEHEAPYMIVITMSKKKHLFYRAKWNYGGEQFAVNLETETIYTTRERMRQLFMFVESLQTLGQSKQKLSEGEIRHDILSKVGLGALHFLQRELKRREIQIPLYCGQTLNISEEEALCYLNSIL